MEDPAPSGAAGLKSAVTRVAASALSLLHTRIELAFVELAEERERLQVRLALLLGGLFLLQLGAMALGALVVVHFWDSHRLAGILGVALVYFIAGIALLRAARARGRDAQIPFAATLAELEKDREWLARHGVSPAADRRDEEPS